MGAQGSGTLDGHDRRDSRASRRRDVPDRALGSRRHCCVVLDHCLGGCIAIEDAVPALRFVRRIADIAGVAANETVVAMLSAAFASPTPEIASLKRAARVDAAENLGIDEFVETVLENCRSAGIEASAIARESEFLDYEGLVELARDADLLPDVVVRVALDGRPGA